MLHLGVQTGVGIVPTLGIEPLKQACLNVLCHDASLPVDVFSYIRLPPIGHTLEGHVAVFITVCPICVFLVFISL